MTVYLLTIFSSSVLALMADKNQRGCLFYGRKQLPSLVTIILIVFSTIPAILTAGFRYGIGVDYTPIYEATFYTVLSGGTQIEY